MICPPSSSATGTSVTSPSIRAASQTSFSVAKGVPICRSPSNNAYITPPAQNAFKVFERRNVARSGNTTRFVSRRGQSGLLPHVILDTCGWRTILVSLDVALGRAHASSIHRSVFPGAVRHAGLLHARLRSRSAVLCNGRTEDQGKETDSEKCLHGLSI